MGCWNATCNITNLPIHAGDKVVLIPLVKVKEQGEYNVCYPTDVFVPFGLPLFGEYDEYGSVKNIKTCVGNETHLMNDFSYRFKDDSEESRFKHMIINSNFEIFVKRVLCTQGGVYIQTDSMLHTCGMAEINFMMIHAGVYDIMIQEVANRKPYGSKKNMRHTVAKNILDALIAAQKNISSCKKLADEIKSGTGRGINAQQLIDALERESYLTIAKEVFAVGMLNPCTTHWISMAKRLVASDIDDLKHLVQNDDAEDLITQTVNLQLFTRALAALRKGYLCDSGVGSQSEETRMHYLIAKYVIKHIKDVANARKKDDDDGTASPCGAREIFFS